MSYSLKSSWSFPKCLWKDYLRPSHYTNWLKHAYQRVTQGYSYHDLYSIDYHIANILIEALPYYKNSNPKLPIIKYLNADRDNDWMAGSVAPAEHARRCARWDDMIDEIIAPFIDEYREGNSGHTFDGMNEHQVRMGLALELLGDNFQRFWY